MQIFVDADACPKPIKEILYRAAKRAEVRVILVANTSLRTPPSRYVRSVHVRGGRDVADDRIVELMQPGDLVVTAGIPLASRVIAARGLALNPREQLYSEENIGERLAIRNLLDELRSDGVRTRGPAPPSKGHRQGFANQLDRFLARI